MEEVRCHCPTDTSCACWTAGLDPASVTELAVRFRAHLDDGELAARTAGSRLLHRAVDMQVPVVAMTVTTAGCSLGFADGSVVDLDGFDEAVARLLRGQVPSGRVRVSGFDGRGNVSFALPGTAVATRFRHARA